MLDEWYANFLSKEKDFTYWSDITQTNSFATFKNENDTQSKTAFDLLGQIADTFKGDIDLHDSQINVLKKLGTDTQEVLTTAKNISSFVNSSNIDDIVTRLYVTSTFKVGDKEDKKELREQHKKELAALRETQKRASKEYNAKKKSQQMQEEINSRYARELSKQTKKTKRSGHTVKSYSQIANEVANKYRDREVKAAQRKLESQAQADRRKAEIDKLKAQQKEEMAALDEEITISLVVESPLINDYPFVNEMAVSNNELQTAEELEEWAMEHFTKENIDKPKNSIKVSYEQLSEKISRGDTVILKYLKYDVDERIRIVETHYDPMLERWKSFVLGSKEGKLGSEISSSSQTAELRANAYTDAISYDFAKKVKEQVENVNKVFEKKEELFKKQIEDGIEVSKAKAEVVKNEIREEINNSITELNHKIDNMSSSSIEDLRRQVEENKTISEATIKMMGTEDSVIYSKNRLEGSPERYIPPGTEYIEVTHNGDGFELGQQYTISWEAVCVKRDFYDVTVRLSRALPHAANVMLIDKYGAFPTGALIGCEAIVQDRQYVKESLFLSFCSSEDLIKKCVQSIKRDEIRRSICATGNLNTWRNTQIRALEDRLVCEYRGCSVVANDGSFGHNDNSGKIFNDETHVVRYRNDTYSFLGSPLEYSTQCFPSDVIKARGGLVNDEVIGAQCKSCGAGNEFPLSKR